MYEIRKDDAVLALTEKPNYIYRHEDGFYALCDEAQAQGIAVNGKPYSLHGRTPMEGCETVQLAELDAGGILAQTQAQLNYSQAIFDYLTAKAEYDRIVGKEN